MVDPVIPIIQFGLILTLIVSVIVLRNRWGDLTVTLMAMVILVSVVIRTIDELSNMLFSVDVLGTQSNWIIRWCVMAAVALFLLHSEQVHRKTLKETAERIELEREISELRKASLTPLRAKVDDLEKIRIEDQIRHRHNWDTLVLFGFDMGQNHTRQQSEVKHD